MIAPNNVIPHINQYLGDPRLSGCDFWWSYITLSTTRQLISFFQLWNILKHRGLVFKDDLELIIHAFVPHLDYFFCLKKKELSCLQIVQSSAASMLTHTNRRAHISLILISFHLLPAFFSVLFFFLPEFKKFGADLWSAHLCIRSLLCSYIPSQRLRPSDKNLLMVPCTCFQSRGDCSFQAIAPRLCDDLLLMLCSIAPVDAFKTELKTYLFRKAFQQLQCVCSFIMTTIMFFSVSSFNSAHCKALCHPSVREWCYIIRPLLIYLLIPHPNLNLKLLHTIPLIWLTNSQIGPGFCSLRPVGPRRDIPNR